MFIHRIKLKNFRKFEDLQLKFVKPITVIQADNAKGKSSILEAISLITTQSSPFTSDISNMQNTDRDEYFRIEADIENGDKKEYVLFQQGDKKELIVDKKRTSRKKFSESIFSTIFSPEYIDLLMVSPQQRRDYLDSVICSLDRDYSLMLSNMKKVLKQRNSYLKKLADTFYKTRKLPDKDKLLTYWTNLFAEYSAQVMEKRIKNIKDISGDDFTLVYEPSIDAGDFIDMVDHDEIKKLNSLSLDSSQKKDIALGYTNVGAHRDDWSINLGKDVRTHGSRGEKRMAIGKMIFKIQDLYRDTHNYYPILLLDDISSELDDSNTVSILENALKDEQQIIVTTIRLEDIPKEIIDEATVIEL